MTRSMRAVLLRIAPAMLLAVGLAGSAAAQDGKDGWSPRKQVMFYVPAGAGGGIDMVARTMAKILDAKKLVTQPIAVENRPGGGQVTGTVAFANQDARNDHKLMVASTPFILNYIKKDGNSPIGPDQVYPLAMLQVDYGVIAVRTDSKYKTLKDLLDAVKADPSSVQFVGGGAPGTWDHLNSILLARKAGVDIKVVKYNTYDGGGEALTALLGGHGDAMTSDVSSIKQYVQAGKVRVLGVSSEARMADDDIAKDFPTYKEQGYDVVTTNWRGAFLGKNVPAPAKKYWGDKIAALVDTQEWKDELKKQGVAPSFKDAKGFYDHLKADQATYTQIYTELGMAK